MFANYPILDLNHEVAALELSFFILQTMKLSCGQYRFDVVPIDIEGGSRVGFASQDEFSRVLAIVQVGVTTIEQLVSSTGDV